MGTSGNIFVDDNFVFAVYHDANPYQLGCDLFKMVQQAPLKQQRRKLRKFMHEVYVDVSLGEIMSDFDYNLDTKTGTFSWVDRSYPDIHHPMTEDICDEAKIKQLMDDIDEEHFKETEEDTEHDIEEPKKSSKPKLGHQRTLF